MSGHYYQLYPDVWREHWVTAWAAIGWHAHKDWLLRAMDGFVREAIEAFRQHENKIFNLAVDVKKLQHKVRS